MRPAVVANSIAAAFEDLSNMKSRLLGAILVVVGAFSFLACGNNSQCEIKEDCVGAQVCCPVWGVGGPSSASNKCLAPMLLADGGLGGITRADGGFTGCPGNL
jgi:hypothetical protein